MVKRDTMNKQNCWEYRKCGREKNGINVKISGACPVASEGSAHGLNEGKNGGRMCWVVSDICCDGKVRCSNGDVKDPCFSCEFRYKVIREEGLLNVCKATGLFLQLHDKEKYETSKLLGILEMPSRS